MSLWNLVPCIKMQRAIYLIGCKSNLITARDQGLQHPHPLTDSLPPHLKENGRTDEQKEAQTAKLNLHESTAARWRWKYAGVHSTLSARLWLSVACPLLALTCMYPLGSSSSTSLLLLSLFSPFFLVLSFEFESWLFSHTRSVNCEPHVHETNFYQDSRTVIFCCKSYDQTLR